MKLENISLVLRPRGSYEATDLGIRLLQRNASVVYRGWLMFAMPVMLVSITLASITPWLPALVIWWLKPVYDRLVLFVLSRLVFGERVTLRDIGASWRMWLGNGLIGALTWRRLEFTRAFSLPLFLLEGLKGKRRRQRSKVLQKNTRGQAVLTQVVYLHIEQAIYFSTLMLLMLMLPSYANLPTWSWFIGQDVPVMWTVATCLFYIMAVSLVEPAYVAAGFALYLNRRVELEAWDIELSLRKAAAGGEVPASLLMRGATGKS